MMKWWVLIFLLIAAPVQAATYYVKQGASNTNNCSQAQSPSTPINSFPNLWANCSINAGDTINADPSGGTFTTRLLDTALDNLPLGGTSYSNAVTIQGLNGSTATFRPSSSGNPIVRLSSPGAGLTRQYFIFKNVNLDGTNLTGGTVVSLGGGGNGGATDHMKFDTVEVIGRPPGASTGIANVCVYVGGDDLTGNFNWFTNVTVHQCGINVLDPGGGIGHAFYVESHGNLFENVEMYDVQGFGIHNYAGDPSDNIYRNLKIHDVCLNLLRGCTAFLLQSGSNSVGYNLQIYRSSQEGIAIVGDGHSVFNSTVYNNNTQCASAVNGCNPVVSVRDNTGAKLQNVLIVDNANGTNSIDTTNCSSCTVDHNLTTGTASGHFVNAASDDFHLKSGSTAIGAGTALAAAYNMDYDGTIRPQGADGLWDIGAFEFAAIVPLPTVTVSLPISGCTTTSTSPKACTTSNSTLTITGTSSLP